MKIEFPDDSAPIEESGTIVYLLGAGCSAHCGAPLMADFMRRVRRKIRLGGGAFKDDYDFLSRFQHRCQGISHYMDRWWDNIEELYTQLHLRELAEVGSPDEPKRAARVIWDVYRQASKGFDGYENFGMQLSHAAFDWCTKRQPRPVVLTTNYDAHLEATMLSQKYGGAWLMPAYPVVSCTWPEWPLFEKARERAIVEVREPDEFFRCPRQREVFGIDAMWVPIEIIKLHGSVNWFNEVSNPASLQCPFVAKSPAGFVVEDESWGTLVREGKAVPDIVPPLLGKLEGDVRYRLLLKRAVHAIRNAVAIVVAGYSFPQTDLFMTRLLSEGLMRNTRLDFIRIINSDERQEWRHRVLGMFAKSWAEHSIQFPSANRFGAGVEQFRVSGLA